MPGASAATQSSRCGKRPKLPARVGATMRETASHAANTLNGSRILSCMRDPGLFDRRNHIERGFRMVLEFIAQNALAAVERVFEAYGFSSHAAELLGCEEWLSEKSLESPRPRYHGAVVG